MPCADEMLAVATSRKDELAASALAPRPRRHVAVLACMDARIDLSTMLGLEPGDAHVIRNAGGLVTDDVLRSLSVSQRLLGTEEIVVVMHEGCGLHGASEERFADELARDGALPAVLDLALGHRRAQTRKRARRRYRRLTDRSGSLFAPRLPFTAELKGWWLGAPVSGCANQVLLDAEPLRLC